MARIPNQDLINLRNTFGVDPEYLLSDLNDYTMDAPVEEVNDGLASLNTGLPTYTQDGDGGNNFLQYSNESAPAYIRPTDIAAPINNDIKLASLNPVKDLNSYLDLEAYNEALSKVGIPENEMFIEDRPIKEAKQLGILQSIKNKGTGLLDFIRGGGITGNILRGLGSLEQNPDAILMRDYYGGEDGSNIKDGTIQSGLMAGYNPVSGGFLNMISGGRFGRPTNYGLQRAYQKRINMIQNNLDNNKYRDPRKQIEKIKKLKEEKRKEAMALEQRTIDRAREANPDVYRNAANVPGALGPSGGFSTTGREGAFSSKSGRGRQDY